MKTINFSHAYDKMPAGYYLSKLLDVIPVKLEDLSQEFIKYDTFIKDDEYYKLPAKGDYMILMLRSTAITDPDGDLPPEYSQLWTTIRSQWGKSGNKLEYYRGLIGEVLECKIVPIAQI